MPSEVRTCPKCGAMITPQLARCRQCKAFLHGTNLEGFLLESLVPAKMMHAPGTATLVFAIFLGYAIMVVASGPTSLLGFSSFTLRELGATHGPSILRGQYWRFVTSIFVHHDLVHLAFNVSSLVAVGEIVERIFDRKKMLLIYLASGVVSMIVSHLWYVYARGDVTVVSGGASGAVCGMIGAALVGARKLGPGAKETASSMKRWAVFMVIWGVAMPGINNAAHLGGFLVGALLAFLTPSGDAQSVLVQQVLSVLALASFGAILGATVLMVMNARGYPVALDDDLEPRAIFGMRYYEGGDPEHSAQRMIFELCGEAAKVMPPTDKAMSRCELNVRVNHGSRVSYERLALLHERLGDPREAALLRDVARRLPRFEED